MTVIVGDHFGNAVLDYLFRNVPMVAPPAQVWLGMHAGALQSNGQGGSEVTNQIRNGRIGPIAFPAAVNLISANSADLTTGLVLNGGVTFDFWTLWGHPTSTTTQDFIMAASPSGGSVVTVAGNAIPIPAGALSVALPGFDAVAPSPMRLATNRFMTMGAGDDFTTIDRAELRIPLRFGPTSYSKLRLIAPQFVARATTADTAWPNAYTIEAAIEIGGTFHGFTWSGSQQGAVAAGLGVVLSDELAGLTVPASETTAFLRVGFIVAPGGSIPRQMRTNAGQPQLVTSSGATSQIFGTGALTVPLGGGGSSIMGPCPLGIIGEPLDPDVPAVLILGDGIAQGFGSAGDADISGDGAGQFGYIGRGLAGHVGSVTIPHTNGGRQGESLQQFRASGAGRLALLPYVTHVICAYGHEDIDNGRTLGEVQGDQQWLWGQITAAGPQAYQTRITPATNAGNTAILSAGFSNGGVRHQLNTWIGTRVGIDLDGMIDALPTFQDGTDTTLWSGGAPSPHTADGIRPDVSGAEAGDDTVRTVTAGWL